jgi:transposase
VLIYEYKLRISKAQQSAIDEAIRTVQFIRNKALRLWMDGRGVGQYDIQALCTQLAHEYPFAARLNSMARQASADRAWQSIARFYKHCREKKPGKKGYPRYYGLLHGIPIVAVSPRFTTQDCSGCGTRVKKTLSMRTHLCPGCGLVLDRDHNAARNILVLALHRTAGQAETGTLRSANASGQPPAGRRTRVRAVKVAG